MTFKANEHVCVRDSTAVAEFIQNLGNGYGEVKWLDNNCAKWETKYPLTELKALGTRRSRRSNPRHLEEYEVPVNKKIKVSSNVKEEGIKKKKGTERKSAQDDDTVMTADETVTSVSSATLDEKPTTAKKASKAPDLWEVTDVAKDQGLKEVAKLLPKDLKKCAEQVIHFFLFCYERQMVWERRNREEYVVDEQYTESWAMQGYFFCNVSAAR